MFLTLYVHVELFLGDAKYICIIFDWLILKCNRPLKNSFQLGPGLCALQYWLADDDLAPQGARTLTHLGRHKMAAIFQTTFSNAFFFFNEKVWTSNKISLKFVPNGPINYIPVLVQIMDHWWSDYRRMHVCITRPQWVNNHGINIALSRYPASEHIWRSKL